MADYEFGDEHLKFLFERWKINEHLSSLDESEGELDGNIDLVQENVDWLDGRLNNYIYKLESWVEGKEIELQNLFNDSEEE